MQEPDEVIAKDTPSKFQPHPEGQFVAVCVDVINLGQRVRVFGSDIKIQPSMAVVFATEERREDGEPVTISAEFTVSMHEKSNLRKFLEQWRGKTYSAEQAAEGVPVNKMAGVPALITVEHKTSRNGRTYGAINSVSPLPKQMQGGLPDVSAYKRPDWWDEKKRSYAAEVDEVETRGPEADEPGDHDDDIPF